jgi:hypothetical protein
MFEDGRNGEEEEGADMRYPALLIGTDLAAATRPLHLRDTGNPTRDLVAAPTRDVVVMPGPMCIASGIKARRDETALVCLVVHRIGLGSREPDPAI